MATNSANKRLAKNSLYLSIRMVVVLLITFYTTRVILSTLGVEDYGVYNVVCGFVSMFAFLNTSMSNGIQRFFNYEYGKNGNEGAVKVYNTAILIQAILAVIILIVIESFGIWYINNKMVIPENRMVAAQWVFQFAVISFIFNIFQAPYTAAVMAHEKMDFYAIISIFDAVFKLLIVYTLPIIGGDFLITYGFLWMFISVINWFLYFIYSKRNFSEIILIKVRQKDLFRSMLSFSGWNMFGSFSGVMKEQGINLIINFFFGPVVNAARAVSSQINSGIQSFVQNITTPIRPQVIQSFAQGNISRTMNLTYSISKLSCYFIAIMAVPICYEIDFILKLWLGANIPEHTITFTFIIIACSFQGNLNAALSTIVHATGHMKKYQFWCSLIKIMSVPASYIMLSLGYYPEIALLCIFIFDWLGHIAGICITKTLINFQISEYIKNVIFPIIFVLTLSIVFTYPLHTLISNEIIRFFVVSFGGATIVIICMYTLGLNQKERELINNLLSPLINKFNFYDKRK